MLESDLLFFPFLIPSLYHFRFMICCDRCEEWFHGDCVGISEARGRLLERNGEDYICPNCTILQVQDETTSEATDEQESRCRPGGADGTDCTSIGTVEQKSCEDQGIKGRIEKAANPSGKKKLKIFQPVSICLPRQTQRGSPYTCSGLLLVETPKNWGGFFPLEYFKLLLGQHCF
jgi:hypothetical protein